MPAQLRLRKGEIKRRRDIWHETSETKPSLLLVCWPQACNCPPANLHFWLMRQRVSSHQDSRPFTWVKDIGILANNCQLKCLIMQQDWAHLPSEITLTLCVASSHTCYILSQAQTCRKLSTSWVPGQKRRREEKSISIKAASVDSFHHFTNG